MRLSLKISLFTALGILIVLGADGYVRTQRELGLARSEVARDHRTLGRILTTAARVTVQRAGPQRALEFVQDVNSLENGINIHWQPSKGAAPSSAWSELVTEPGQTVPDLVTHVPLQLDQPGELVLRESLVSGERVAASMRASIGTSVLLIVLSTAIIFGVGWWLLGTPLRMLVARARQIGEGDLSGRLLLKQNDEMGELANEMNAMCQRLAAAHELADREAAGRLQALQQLRHADRLTTVGKLASGIAHELGTPLNVVDARAQMIARGESQGDEARQDATIISEQTTRMTRIIQQLLDFTRHRRAQRAQHDLAAIVRTSVDLLAPLANRHSVTMRVEGESGPVVAPVDAAQMQQLLMNLLVNAIQAQPNGGEVRARVMRTPAEVRTSAQNGGAIRIVVEDDGPGMEPEVRERMFEPFFTTKAVGQGTGLGLAVVYGIVQEHHGSIDVETAGGAGTRIAVTLPEVSS